MGNTKKKLNKCLKKVQVLAFTVTFALSTLFTAGVSHNVLANDDVSSIPTCDLTIIEGVHTWQNKAQATGVCKGLEEGYFIEDSGERQFIVIGATTSVVDYDGQKFELATPQYSRIFLTVHTVNKGDQTTTNPKPSPKGWVKENGQWVNYNQGKKQTGWLYEGSKWYYLDNKGIMRTGWLYDNAWYLLASSGEMKTGWQKVNGTWYYFAKSGSMKTGWLYDNGWYLFAENGAMKTGWQLVNGTWYYLYNTGIMAANTWIGGYHLNGNGAWIK